MIPKIIHFCWFGGGEKPALVQKCMSSWRTVLPDWEIREWTEANSPTEVPYVARALGAKRYAFASDYVRFHALYTEGGVYLDTDMELVRNLEPLLDNEMFLGWESAQHINAGIVGAVRGHPVVCSIMEELNRCTGVTFDAIPEIIMRVFAMSGGISPSVKVYATEFFYPYNPFDPDRSQVRQLFYSDISSNTFAIHHWAQSWSYSWGERVYRRVRKFLGGAG